MIFQMLYGRPAARQNDEREQRRLHREMLRGGLPVSNATVPDEPRRVILSEDDDDEVVVIEMKDRELSQPEGIRNWFCCLCPIHLASSDEIHVLVPCGHVLCKDCSEGVEYCPNPGCRKEVSKIAMPNIQRDETGSISTSQTEAEKLKLEERIRQIEADIEKAKKNRPRSEQMHAARIKLSNSQFENAKQEKHRRTFRVKETKLKLKIAQFMRMIEVRREPGLDEPLCPSQQINDGGRERSMAKSIFKVVAQLMAKNLTEANRKLEWTMATSERDLKNALREKDDFSEPITELVYGLLKQDNKSEMLKRFEKFVPKRPDYVQFNASI